MTEINSDGLEVVVWVDAGTIDLPWEKKIVATNPEYVQRNGGLGQFQPLVTLSQASSVIAGLERELEVMTERQSVSAGWCHIWKKSSETAEARISSLEKENKRLRQALGPFAAVAEHDIGDDETDDDIFWPISNARYSMSSRLRVGHLRAARQATEDHNG